MKPILWIFLAILVSCNKPGNYQKNKTLTYLETLAPYQQAAVVDSIADAVRQVASPEDYADLLQMIKKLNERTESPELQISQIYLQAELERLQGNNDVALQILHQALPLFNSSKRESTKLKILNLIGYLYQQKGNVKIPFDEYIKSLKTEELQQLGVYTKYLTTHFAIRRSHDKALEYAEKQYRIFALQKDTTNMIEARTQLGQLFFELKRFNEAASTFQEAIELIQNPKLLEIKTTLFLDLGKTYYFIGNKEESKKNLLMALDLSGKQPHNSELNTQILCWLGVVESEIGNLNSAQLYLTECISRLNNDFKNPTVREATLKLAQTFAKIGKSDKAMGLYKNLLANSKEDYQHAATAALEISNILSFQGRHAEANHYLKEHLQLIDSARQLEKLRMLGEIETQYDLTLKEQRINLLYKEGEIKNRLYQKTAETNHILIVGLILLVILLATTTRLLISGIKKNKLLRLQNLEIQEKNEELNQMNDELNAINQQLIASETQLTEEIAAQDKLLSIIAHDLKTPLAALKNILNVYQISKENITPQMMESVINRMNNEVENIFEMLNNLLHWAINHRGKMNIKSSAIDVSTVIEATIPLFTEHCRIKHIKLTKAIHPGLICQTDKNMLQFIVRNFLSNAIKYTPETGEIIISAKKENGKIAIRVKDSGIGISKEDIECLKNQREITPKPGTNGEKGAGIGLILCYEFAQKINATIEIESTMNVGSTFSLILQC